MNEPMKQINASLIAGQSRPAFRAGDTVIVNVKVKEGSRERLQAFEGVVLARHNAGINSSFTVRKISYGEGVERVFPLYSPTVESITLKRRGKVRRAKLYYLRTRRGKAARIKERLTLKSKIAKKPQKTAAKDTKAAKNTKDKVTE